MILMKHWFQPVWAGVCQAPYVAVTYQVALEAVVPLNRAAGDRIGGRLQLLFFLDDFIPSIFGKPLFSEHPLFSR
jgi:hypothetical protein